MNIPMKNPNQMSMNDLFQSSGIDGVRARTGLFETVVDGLTSYITSIREPNTEILRFPPVTNRAHIEKSGYLHSFPNLLGAVCCLQGNEREIRAAVDSQKTSGEWVGKLAPTDLLLTPAACYPLYPIVASRGPVPEAGLMFDVAADCFRHEPSRDVDRFQSFRMREFVLCALPDQVLAFRTRWMARGPEIADTFGVKHQIAPANDPFFGRTGKLMAINQIEQALKFELLIPVRSEEQLTACMSFNYHRDHFGAKWGLIADSGEVMHTGCVAFGIDRLVLALFATHGHDLKAWPKKTREALSL
jgi:seryl-tRNA synthetase